MENKLLLFFLLACLCLGISETKTPRNGNHRAKVLILGAGMSGLAAAHQLEEFGVKDYIILEAADHIGGRIKETRFGGKTVELGANWIHGIRNNPIYDMAKKYGLKGVLSNYEDYVFRDTTGRNVTKEADKEFEKIEHAIENSEKVGKHKEKYHEPDVPYRSALHINGWEPRTPLEEAVEYFYFDFEYATGPGHVSLKNGDFYRNEELFSGKELFVTDQRGLRYIAKRFAAEFLSANDARLRLGEKVKSIRYKSTGVMVTTDRGVVYEGDYAILTFSVGVLNSGEVKFKPELPEWKKEIYSQFEMNLYTKIFIKFPSNVTAFWDDKQYIVYVHPRSGYYTAWQNLEATGLFPKGTNMLLATVTGSEAKRISLTEKNVVKQELTEVLRDMYGEDVPEPEDILIPDWLHDPLTRGSYSNWPLGVTKKLFKALTAPLGALFFAGEACSQESYGYVHGAYFSGVATAKSVVLCMKKIYCPPTSYKKNISHLQTKKT